MIRLDIPPPRTDDGEKYAFVEYRNPEDCERALELDGKNLPYALKDGLVVQLARSDPYSMRRGGFRGRGGYRGGYGGGYPPRGGYAGGYGGGYGGGPGYPPRGGYGYAPRGGYGYAPRGGYGYAPRGGYNGYNGGGYGGRGGRGGYGEGSPYGGSDREYRSHRGGPMRDQGGYDSRSERMEGGDIHDGPINEGGNRQHDSGIRGSDEGNSHHNNNDSNNNSGGENKPHHREERRYSRSPSRSPRRDRSRSPERYDNY